MDRIRFYCRKIIRIGLVIITALFIITSGPTQAMLWVDTTLDTVGIQTDITPNPFSIPGGQAISVDELSGNVWIYDGNQIKGYDQAGSLISTLTITENGTNPRLRVSSRWGSIWLAFGSELHVYDFNGTLTHSKTLPFSADLIDMGTIKDHLFISDGHQLLSYKTSNNTLIFQLFQPTDTISALTFDNSKAELWVIVNDTLRRHTMVGDQVIEYTSSSFFGVTDMDADGSGGLWVAFNGALKHYNSQLTVLADITPFGGASITDLRTDQTDHSVWVGAGTDVYHYSSTGTLTDSQTTTNIISGTHTVETLGIYKEFEAPLMTIVQPVNNAVLSISTPTLRVDYSSAHAGIVGEELKLKLNYQVTSPNCTYYSDYAECIPVAPLEDGDYFFEANIKDNRGNASYNNQNSLGSINFSIQSQPPAVTVNEPIDGAVVENASLFVSGQAINFTSTQAVTINNTSATVDSAGNFSLTIILNEGPNTIEIIAQDDAGNFSTYSLSVTLNLDIDGDGIPNALDLFPDDPNESSDLDGDGIGDNSDLCPGTFSGIHVDNTGCPIVLENDADNDTYVDSSDNCPTIFNPDQTDTDTNGTGDACEIVGSITITSPTVSQVINTSTTSVTGTFIGPVGSGVTVNGRRACVYSNQFVINNILLNTGDYTITAQITPTIGIGESTQVTINRNDDSLYTIEPNTDCAVAPFDAGFTLDHIDNSIQQIDIDYDNDGVTDDMIFDFSNPVLVHTYTNPGIYQVNITGFDIDSNPYSQNLSIIVQDGAAIDMEIQTSWGNITAGLSANNTAQALNELTPGAQEKYAPVFDTLQGNLPGILSTFSSLQVVDINSDYAEYAINRTIDGVNRIFLIYFVKDENGNWKLDAM